MRELHSVIDNNSIGILNVRLFCSCGMADKH